MPDNCGFLSLPAETAKVCRHTSGEIGVAHSGEMGSSKASKWDEHLRLPALF